MSSAFFACGLLMTMMKSYSALGPNLSVILLVSSFEIGFSIYHDSYFTSLFTIKGFEASPSPAATTKGNTYSLMLFYPVPDAALISFSLVTFLMSGNCFIIQSFLYLQLRESTDSSIIYSESLKLATMRVDPRNLPGRYVPKFIILESQQRMSSILWYNFSSVGEVSSSNRLNYCSVSFINSSIFVCLGFGGSCCFNFSFILL